MSWENEKEANIMHFSMSGNGAKRTQKGTLRKLYTLLDNFDIAKLKIM